MASEHRIVTRTDSLLRPVICGTWKRGRAHCRSRPEDEGAPVEVDGHSARARQVPGEPALNGTERNLAPFSKRTDSWRGAKMAIQ